MKFHYHPALVQDAVFHALREQEQCGDTALVQEYRRLLQPIYTTTPKNERPPAFHQLDVKFFHKLGLVEPLTTVLDEFPALLDGVGEVLVILAESVTKQAAQLAPTRSHLGIKVIAEFFLDASKFQVFLRHELMHISDMLDPTFQYENSVIDEEMTQPEENWLRECYGVIWDVYIDSRLARQGRASFSRAHRLGEFNHLFESLPLQVREEIFDSLWEMQHLSHPVIWSMANKVESLAEITGLSEELRRQLPKLRYRQRGNRCPLCNFPTHSWAEDVEVLDSFVLATIRADQPTWSPDSGACAQCMERYLMLADQ